MRNVFLLVLFAAGSASAQQLLGVTGSNYAGTNALYHNPAQVTDSRHKLFVNLATFDHFVTNNYIGWDTPYSYAGFMLGTVPEQYRSEAGLVRYRTENFPETLNGKPKRAYQGIDLRGPSVLYTINDRFGVAVTSRGRFLMGFNDISEPVARLIRYGTTDLDGLQPNAQDNTLNLNVNGYAEVGGTLGAVVYDGGTDFVKAGLTLKRVVGLYSAHLLADNLDYRFVPVPRSRRQNILIESADVRYGYTTEGALLDARPTPQFLLGNRSAGGGWGLDLGLVYEHRPDIGKYDYRERGTVKYDPGVNKYQYRVSLSLMDLGGIRYRNPNYVNAYEVSRTNRLIDGIAIGKLSGGDAYANAVSQVLALNPSDRQTAFRSALPTTFQASVDVNYRENVYVNVAWVQRLRRTDVIAAAVPSQLSVTPRYERKWLEAALPVVLFDEYRALTVGLALRLGPVFLGSDHLPGFANFGKPKGFNFYAGATVPILRRRPPGPDACWYERSKKRGLEKLMFWRKN
jgi:hypothetical protein